MAEVGIIITANDVASKTLKSMGGVAKKSLGAVRSVADKATKSFDAFGKVITGVNQALEIGKKAFELGRRAMELTIAKSLEFRKANDPVLKWFQDMKRDTDLLGAAIGDALIPVIQGLAEGFGLVGHGAADFVRQNRKIIGTKILGYFVKMGQILISVVAKALLTVSKIWNGWKMLIGTLSGLLQKYWAMLLGGASKAIGALGKVASALGADGIAAKAQSASEMVALLGDTFSESGEKALDSALDASIALGEQERAINGVANSLRTGLVKGAEVAQKAIENSIAGTNRSIDDQKKKLEELKAQHESVGAKVDEFLKARHEERLRRLALEESIAIAVQEKEAVAAQEKLEKQTELTEKYGEVFSSVTDGIVAGFFQQGMSAEDAAKQTTVALIDSVTAAVAAYAAEAAAGAFAAYASIPYVGPAIGAAAAAVAGAAVMALGAGLKSLVSSMADGGIVTGGQAGRDSVPAILMPGEQVMSVGERSAMQKFMTRLLGAQAAQTATGMAAAPQGGGRAPVVINQRTELRTWTPNINEETQMARRLEERSRARLARQGMLTT